MTVFAQFFNYLSVNLKVGQGYIPINLIYQEMRGTDRQMVLHFPFGSVGEQLQQFTIEEYNIVDVKHSNFVHGWTYVQVFCMKPKILK